MEGIMVTSCILAIIAIVGFVFAWMVRLASVLDGRQHKNSSPNDSENSEGL